MIKDNRLKDSVLDDSASIYSQREEISEKEKIKNMTLKEKFAYFNHYYRNKTLLTIGLTAFVIYFLYTVLSPKPVNQLFVVAINNTVTNEAVETITNDMTEILAIDPETEDITIDNSFYIGGEGDVSEYTIANEQKLAAYLFSGELDIIIAPEEVFKTHAYYGNFHKITDQLPTNLISKLANNFLYTTLEDTNEVGPYGIYLDDTVVYDNTNTIMKKPVLGIVANSSHEENAIEFIKYIFNLY